MIQASISSVPSAHGAVNFSQPRNSLVTDVIWPSASVWISGRCVTSDCSHATVSPAASNACTEMAPLVIGEGAEPSMVNA